MDYVKSIHVDPIVMWRPIDWRSKSNKRKNHKYLGMMLNYSEKGKFKIDMNDYVKQIIKMTHQVRQ